MGRSRLVIASVLLCSIAIAAFAQRAASEAKPGVVQGTLTYERDRKRPWRYQRYYVKGRNAGPLAEAVVALVPKVSEPTDRSPAFQKSRASQPGNHHIDQKDFRFTPETIAIRTGDRVKFTNSDGALHNVHSRTKTSQFSVNLRRGNENVQTFDKAGGTDEPVRLGCIFHASMQAWIYVFDHPYYQVTAKDGKFRMNDVPAGDYELVVVHPSGELKSVTPIQVTPGKATALDVRVSPDNKLESKPDTK